MKFKMKEKKDSVSVPLTNCCLKGDKPETISIATDCKDTYSVEEANLINGASIFQGPSVNIDIEFQDLTYEVKIKKHGEFKFINLLLLY